MHSYSKQRRLGSYTVNKTLAHYIENYISQDIPTILNLTKEDPHTNFYLDSITVTVFNTHGEEVFKSLKDYKFPIFRNGTSGLLFTANFEDPDSEQAFDLKFRLDMDLNANDFAISITDENPREKVTAIEAGLKAVMQNDKSFNWFWCTEVIWTFFFFAMASLVGTIGYFYNKASQNTIPDLHQIALLLVVFSPMLTMFFKGYCSFESLASKRKNFWFKWISVGIVCYLLFMMSFVIYQIQSHGVKINPLEILRIIP